MKNDVIFKLHKNKTIISYKQNIEEDKFYYTFMCVYISESS